MEVRVRTKERDITNKAAHQTINLGDSRHVMYWKRRDTAVLPLNSDHALPVQWQLQLCRRMCCNDIDFARRTACGVLSQSTIFRQYL